jgi:hypothetical protein
VILRLACALAIATQLILLVIFLKPTGRSAIVYSFLGHPLLGVAILLGLIWWWRNGRGVVRADEEGGPGLR